MTVFTDRADAGRRLAHRMKTHRGEDVVVLGLPRGGVVVAYEVALALGAPLDVVVVRKLGVPYQPEVAMGAIGEDGVRVIDEDTVAHAGITEDELAAIERRERALLDTRVAHYRAGRERVDLTGRLALIVDDGMATGATARAACQVARRLGAARVIAAVPVASCGAIRAMTDADEVYCLAAPHPFVAVGSAYDDFSPTTDEEVVVLLDLARRRDPDHPGPAVRRSTEHALGLQTNTLDLLALAVDRDDRRFVEDDAATADIDEGIRGPQVDRHVVRHPLEPSCPEHEKSPLSPKSPEGRGSTVRH